MDSTQAHSVGRNRTGIKASPMDGRSLERMAPDNPPRPTASLQATALREDLARHADRLGSVPPAATAMGLAGTAVHGLRGHRLAALIDKLGERLVFERSGVRAYEAVLVKLDALGAWHGGPTRELLLQQCNDELQHFRMLKQMLEHLGADPTALTPSADVAAVEASGVFKVLADPRTSLSQALHALLVLEDVDSEGWDLLVQMAGNTELTDMARAFREAIATEETHRQRVRGWLGNAVLADTQRVGDDGRRTSMH